MPNTLEPNRDDNDKKINFNMEIEKVKFETSKSKENLPLETSLSLQLLVNSLNRLIIVDTPERNSGYVRIKEEQLNLYKAKVEQLVTLLWVEKETIKSTIKKLGI